MLARRIVPCLDVKDGVVVKGVNFQDLREAGDPVALAREYYRQGADELVYLDITATLEGRESFLNVVERTANSVFIPLTVGGGVRTAADVNRLLQSGADKVAMNSAAVLRPDLIKECAARFGSQCVVVAIDAAWDDARGDWYVHTHAGSKASGLPVLDWAVECEALGAGEILLTSIDRDGTNQGYDLDLLEKVCGRVSIPVIASGGASGPGHMVSACRAGAAAVLAASIFHYGTWDIPGVKAVMAAEGVPVRTSPSVARPPVGWESTLEGLFASLPDEALIPVVAQSAATGEILMLAYANREAVGKTLSTGYAHFFSRSRQQLWKKGEASRNLMEVEEIRVDCDADALVYLVRPQGPACHTGERSCFFRRLTSSGLAGARSRPSFAFTTDLLELIAARRQGGPEKSYTTQLLKGPVALPAAKVLEEAAEVVQAALDLEKPGAEIGSRAGAGIDAASGDAALHVVHEAADLIYHLMVLLASVGLSFQDALAELERRRTPAD